MKYKENNNKNFLALTAIEEFWDTTRKIYFLGEWCRQYSRKTHWEKLDAKVVESTQFKTKSHYEYHLHAISVFENLFPKIAEQLNKLHQTNHSLKYWRLLIGPFLFWYVQIIYDRFLYLQSAFEENPEFETWGLSSESYFTPLNTNEFMYFSGHLQSYNYQLFTQILDLKFKRPVAYKNMSMEKENACRQSHFTTTRYKFRTRFLLRVLNIMNKIPCCKAIGLLNSGFSFKEMVKLFFQSKFKILPLLPIKPLSRAQALGDQYPSLKKVDIAKRKEIFNIREDDFLSQLILETLVINMPLVFVELYKEQVDLSKVYFPFDFSVILDEQAGAYDQYKFWIAEQVEKGAKLIGQQHGGGYGMQKGHPAEYSERDVSHFYFSWGWSYSNNVIGLPVISISRKMKQFLRTENRSNLNRMIWVSTLGQRTYTTGFCDWLLTQEAYLNSQKEFFSSLNTHNADKICMRASPSAYCQEQVNDTLVGLKIYIPRGRDDFFSDMNTAKIVILDHPSTSFLFVLAFNIPTILFWDEKYFPLCEEAMSYIEVLKNTGIYHDSPKGAADHLNKISENPYPWWNSNSVQLARQQFCNHFVRTSPDFLNEWKEILMMIYKQERICARKMEEVIE